MPATFAHPAFAWPLRRLNLPFGALCVGSSVPDLGHVFRGPWTDHTALSVVAFSLPVGVLCFYVFELFVAPNLVEVAPTPWREALRRARTGPRPSTGRVVLAVTLAAALHLAVDGMTHIYGAPVQAFPGVMQVTLLETGWGSIKTFHLLQLAGTCAGTVFLMWALRRWDRAERDGPVRLRDLRGLGLTFAVAGACAVAYGWRESRWLQMPDRRQVFIVEGAMAGLLMLCIEALAVATWVALHRTLRQLRAGSG